MPSPLLSAPETPRIYRARRRRRPLLRRALTISLRLTFIAMVAAIAGSGWYLAKKGFGRKWRKTIVQELHDRGVEASVRRLTLDPFRGLVAKDVRIYDYKKRESTLALISEISLDINYAALLHHQPFLNAIDIRNGELTVPLPDATRNSGSRTRASSRSFETRNVPDFGAGVESLVTAPPEAFHFAMPPSRTARRSAGTP